MQENNLLKILIVEDHAIVRDGLKLILTENLSIEEIGEARDSQEAIRLVRENDWDLVLLDINIPGKSGLEVLNEMRPAYPKLPILILSMHSENQFAIRTLKAGADGYVTKERASDELINAIQKVLSGGKYISPSLAEKLAVELNHDSNKALHENLSDREYEIMYLIASGKAVSNIAETLCLSVKTISTYRSRTLEKMKMKTNAELIHYAIRNQLVN